MRRALHVLLIAGFLTGAAGCDRSPSEPVAQATCLAQEPKATAAVPPTDPSEGFSLAGIESPEDVRKFLRELQAAVSSNDRSVIVGLVRVPFTTYSHGHSVRQYKTRNALLRDFDKVFTVRVLKAIREARLETLFVNWHGVMIGDGEVWFDRDKDGIRIKAVNG